MATRVRSVGPAIYFLVCFCAGLYFTFAAIQGSYGIFRRVQIDTEIAQLTDERDALKAETDRLTNLTHRLSDNYLDIDLLDERAREVLGLTRPDEIVIR